jgi:hypothetical protein
MAQTLHSSVGAVVRSLGVEAPTSAGHLNRDTNLEGCTSIARRLGCSPEAVVRTTLRRWEWLGLLPARVKRGYSTQTWQRGSGARFCTECLTANGGRWQLAWYLHWSFICVNHSTLLESVCPQCGSAPRMQKPGTRDLRPSNALDLNCGCGGQVEGGRVERLPQDDPRMMTQQRINSLLAQTPSKATPYLTAGRRVATPERLADLSLITHLIIRSLREHPDRNAFTAAATRYDLQDLDMSEDWAKRVTAHGQGAGVPTPQVLHREIVKSAADVAACITLADAILESHDEEHLVSGLLWIQSAWRTQIQQRAARGQLRCSSVLMDAITGGVRQTRANWFAALQVRYPLQTDVAQDLSHLVPAAVPPDVRAELTTIRGELREAAAVAGLVSKFCHPEIPVHEMARHLGLAHVAADLAATWAQLQRTSKARPDIEKIARGLPRGSESPGLSWADRRAIWIGPTPLPDDVMRDLALTLRTRNSPTLLSMASLFVWERLTGSDGLLTPQAIATYGAFRVRYRQVRQRWSDDIPQPLHKHLLTTESEAVQRSREPLEEEAHNGG